MTRNRMVVILTAVCLTLTLGVFAADKPEKVKVPKAKSVLSKVAKNLVKSKSFNVTCDITGGISKSADHAVSEVTVSKRYNGDVYRNVMNMPDEKAIRTGKKGVGAISSGGTWYRLLSLPSGRMVDGLFPLPQTLLAPALKNAKKVEWIYVGDEEDVVEKAPAKKGEKGSTAVVDEKDKVHKGLPHVLRVELAEKVSVEHFIAVQNSGCMDGG